MRARVRWAATRHALLHLPLGMQQSQFAMRGFLASIAGPTTEVTITQERNVRAEGLPQIMMLESTHFSVWIEQGDGQLAQGEVTAWPFCARRLEYVRATLQVEGQATLRMKTQQGSLAALLLSREALRTLHLRGGVHDAR